MYPDPTLTLADQILGIVGVFLKTLAPEACRLRIGLLSVAIWNRVRRFERRFLALYAMWKAGTLPPPRPSPAIAGEGAQTAPFAPSPASAGEGWGGGASGTQAAAFDPSVAASTRPASMLPRGFAWLHKMLPLSAGTLGGRMRELLHNHPEMRAFVAECPQVGRVLRPICKMTGVKPPDYLALPKRPRKPGLRRRPAAAPRLRQPRRRDFTDPREEALAWMRWSAATGKPVDPRKMSPAAFGCLLHWPKDDNCPPPEIGYGGRAFPPLPKDYKRPDWG